jgi:probable F420-dependent oxidoreductase
MKVGITMFPTDYAVRPDELARAVEERGFESLWFPEHTHIPTSRRTPFPAGGELPREYSHTHDPFVALTAAAVVTETLRLATGICLLPQRHPITTAKTVASLDTLSGGRFLFGIGGGWNVEEMEHHGATYDTRFARMREQILAMKEIWTRDEAEFHGEHVDFEPSWSWPKPVQKPHPPILLGGHSRYTRQRVIELGDGWLPIGFSADAVLRGKADLEQRAAAAGRDPAAVPVSVFAPPPDRATFDRYGEAGVERVVFMVRPAERDAALAKLDELSSFLA